MGKVKFLFSSVAAVVAALAIGIGVVAKVDPWLFIECLPEPVGMISWMLTGKIHQRGDLPFFTMDGWKDMGWLKPKDLVVATGAKSGTTWLLYCSHQIRIKGSDVPEKKFIDININTPWPELRQMRRQSWTDIRELLNSTVLEDGSRIKDRWDHPEYPFRVFKSHATPEELGIRAQPQVKFIAVVRTGLDVVNSFSSFTCDHNAELLREFGAEMMFHAGCDHVDAERIRRQQTLEDFMPGGKFQGMYFDYVKAWWPHRHDKNVLMMHFNDMVKDHAGLMKKLVDFLEVPLSSSEFSKVSEQCTFKAMKQVGNIGDYHLPLHREYKFQSNPKMLFGGNKFMKGGKSGQGKQKFTQEQQDAWAAVEDATFPDPAMRNWARNGGTLPA